MRCLHAILLIGFGCVMAMPVRAHHPGDHDPVKVWPRIDVIGPLGNRLPPSYRRQFNRPSYIAGKIAHAIAPTSQEAIAWHHADHLGLYDNNGIKGFFNGKKCPPQRVEQLYFYPKPWEVLTVGARRASKSSDMPSSAPMPVRDERTSPMPTEPVGEEIPVGDEGIDMELPEPVLVDPSVQ